jgi:antitoxin component YwqK of YwqJK toxin-antitoxin module
MSLVSETRELVYHLSVPVVQFMRICINGSVQMEYEYDTSGRLLSITPFKNGQIHGIQFMYNTNGRRISEIDWEYGDICVMRSYSETGDLVEVESFSIRG